MAYGSPESDGDLEAYYTHIRGGRPPSPAALENLRERYRAIGSSPLTAVTRRQAEGLARELGVPSFVGMKHAAPFITDGVAAAKAAGTVRLIALPLAPHYAEMSVGVYLATVRKAWAGELVEVRGFHDHPAFVAVVRMLIDEARRAFEPELVIFTAHSLPARIEAEGDLYPERLLESARLVAAAASLSDWEVAFQSASETGEPWFGPNLNERIAETQARRVLVCPIGFVADHLEVLYDVDIEAKALAEKRGIELRRTRSFNARPEFIRALGAIVRDQLLMA